MKALAGVAMFMVAVLLSACAAEGPGGNPGGIFGARQPARSVDVKALPAMRVVGFNVEVPGSLSVSEENSYKPVADIVWREDPPGDRHAQVRAIVEEAVRRGVDGLQGDLPVVLHVTVRQFHALTQRTRYTIGGTHAIDLLLSVTNARSGEVIIPPYLLRVRLEAYGGQKALAAEAVGLTQKVRIIRHLAGLIRQELTGVPAPPAREVELEALMAGRS